MRFGMTRESFIPKDARLVDCSGTDAVVYEYEAPTRTGVPGIYALGFHGRAAKPDFHYRYGSTDARARSIAEYLDGRRRRAAMMAERKARTNAPHSLTVGTILHTSWGYEQTNVEFYEVTRVLGAHMVEVRELAQSRTEDHFMQGTCRPQAGKYIGPPKRVRVSGENTCKVDGHYAWVGGGEHRWTAYA